MLVQGAGRLHREHAGKRDIQIVDYVENDVPALARMFAKRRRGYRAMGYSLTDQMAGGASQLGLRYRTTSEKPAGQARWPTPTSDTPDPWTPVPVSELDAMIDDVLVEAFTPHDQAAAFLEMLDDQLELPLHPPQLADHRQQGRHGPRPGRELRHLRLRRLFSRAPPAGTKGAAVRHRFGEPEGRRGPRLRVDAFYTQYDEFVELYNAKFGRPGQAIMKALLEQGLRTEKQFDEEIEWTWFYLWHHEGRRARHGASMMAPDYAHWHGMYEVAERFYIELIPQAREVIEHAKEQGKTAEAQAVETVVEEILARPEHAWFEEERAKREAGSEEDKDADG